MTTATEIALPAIPRVADVESGAGGYWPSTSFPQTFVRSTTSNAANAGPMTHVFAVTGKITTTNGTPATPSGFLVSDTWSDGTLRQHAAWGIGSANAVGANSLSWSSAGTGTLSWAGMLRFQISGLDPTTPIAATNIAVGTLAAGLNALPKVTPTSKYQNVIHVLFMNSSTQMPQGAGQFKSLMRDDGGYPADVDVAFSRNYGSVGCGIVGLSAGQAEVGVPLGLNFNRNVASATPYMCITFLLNPRPMVKPRALPFTYPGWKHLYTHSWVDEAGAFGTRTFQTPSGVRLSDIQYGDILVLFTITNGNNYGTVTLANTGAFDHVLQSTTLYKEKCIILLKRLTSAADVTAIAASPPTMTNSYASTAGFFYCIIRGVVRSGSYLVGNTYTSTLPAHADGDMLFYPIYIADDDEVYITSKTNSEHYVAWEEKSSTSMMVAFTDILAANTTMPITWIGSNTADYHGVILKPSALTHWLAHELDTTVTLSTVMTSEPGAKFIESQVNLDVTVTTDHTLYRPQFRRPKRNLVWVHDLAGNKVNVLD